MCVVRRELTNAEAVEERSERFPANSTQINATCIYGNSHSSHNGVSVFNTTIALIVIRTVDVQCHHICRRRATQELCMDILQRIDKVE